MCIYIYIYGLCSGTDEQTGDYLYMRCKLLIKGASCQMTIKRRDAAAADRRFDFAPLPSFRASIHSRLFGKLCATSRNDVTRHAYCYKESNDKKTKCNKKNIKITTNSAREIGCDNANAIVNRPIVEEREREM